MPHVGLSAKSGKAARKKEALTDQPAGVLMDTVKGLPPHLFVMLELYSGLHREEVLVLVMGLCVFGSSHSLILQDAKTEK